MVNENKIIELWNSGKTLKLIAEILNVSIPTIQYHKSKIDKSLFKPKKFQDQNYNLTDIQKLFIYGSLLGDLSIQLPKLGKNANLALVHCENQKELFLEKANLLGNFMGSYKLCKSFDKRTCKLYTQYRGHSKAHKEFTQIYNILYKDGRKTITLEFLDLINHPIALAYWFMDDGTNRGTLATNCFSELEVDLLICWLKTKWNIIATKLKNLKNFVIHISAKSRKHFESIIYPYCISSMYYKLIYL